MSGDYVARLRDAIVKGEFMPNERLVEERLVDMLRTNRTNVRAALIRLEHEGLVVLERNRGARVRVLSEREALEITQVRAALEGLVARQAAERANSEDRAALRRILREMRAAYDESNLIAYSDINGTLHAKIREVAAHATASRILANLRSQVVRFRYRSILVPGRAKQSMAEHDAIVKAICANDPDAAEAAMRKHLEGVVKALQTAIEHSMAAEI